MPATTYSEALNLDSYNVCLSHLQLQLPNCHTCPTFSWPAYVVDQKVPQYKLIAEYCNAWRNYGDIQDSWGSVKDIIDWYSVHWAEIRPFHGPGHFSDADMIIIGNFALSYEESRTQMAMWSMW